MFDVFQESRKACTGYDRLQARHYAADDRSMAGLMLFMTAGFQTALDSHGASMSPITRSRRRVHYLCWRHPTCERCWFRRCGRHRSDQKC